MQKEIKILSAGKNLEILSFLKNGKATVEMIYTSMEMPQNLCSHHLGRLKSIDVVKVESKGTFRWYTRNEKVIKEIKKAFSSL